MSGNRYNNDLIPKLEQVKKEKIDIFLFFESEDVDSIPFIESFDCGVNQALPTLVVAKDSYPNCNFPQEESLYSYFHFNKETNCVLNFIKFRRQIGDVALSKLGLKIQDKEKRNFFNRWVGTFCKHDYAGGLFDLFAKVDFRIPELEINGMNSGSVAQIVEVAVLYTVCDFWRSHFMKKFYILFRDDCYSKSAERQRETPLLLINEKDGCQHTECKVSEGAVKHLCDFTGQCEKTDLSFLPEGEIDLIVGHAPDIDLTREGTVIVSDPLVQFVSRSYLKCNDAHFNCGWGSILIKMLPPARLRPDLFFLVASWDGIVLSRWDNISADLLTFREVASSKSPVFEESLPAIWALSNRRISVRESWCLDKDVRGKSSLMELIYSKKVRPSEHFTQFLDMSEEINRIGSRIITGLRTDGDSRDKLWKRTTRLMNFVWK